MRVHHLNKSLEDMEYTRSYYLSESWREKKCILKYAIQRLTETLY